MGILESQATFSWMMGGNGNLERLWFHDDIIGGYVTVAGQVFTGMR